VGRANDRALHPVRSKRGAGVERSFAEVTVTGF